MNTRSCLPFGGSYRGEKVLVTGHTGFKGAWLSLWLLELGAEVAGFSLDPPSEPNLFTASDLGRRMQHHHGDIGDLKTLRDLFESFQPQVVFHLAAQAILRKSYLDPKETIDTNVGGFVNVLESVRTTSTVESLILVTSDKCYEESTTGTPYREGDRLGGRDPYSASKGMAELAASAYHRSFFASSQAGRRTGMATVRSGNVIGGGDFGEDRLVPDGIRALMAGQPVCLRNPDSIRPWLFVLDPLRGYLTLGAELLKNKQTFSGPWNFGPQLSQDVAVGELARKLIACWGEGSLETAVRSGEVPHEAATLRLDSTRAEQRLGWSPLYTWKQAVEETVAGYRVFSENLEADKLFACLTGQIRTYTEAARKANQAWAGA